MRTRLAFVAGTLAAFVMAAAPAFAQKQGGTLEDLPSRQPAQRLDPRGGDDLDRSCRSWRCSTTSWCSIPRRSSQQPRQDRARPGRELGVERRRDQAHLQAAPGREVARRQAVHRADVKCTWDALIGKGDEKLDIIRKNPRKVWYMQPQGRDDQRRPRGDLRARPAAALVPVHARRAATRRSIPATCRRPRHALQADRHRPVQGRRVQAQRIDQAGAQSRLLEEGPALSRRHRLDDRAQPQHAHAGLRRRRVRHDVRPPTSPSRC